MTIRIGKYWRRAMRTWLFWVPVGYYISETGIIDKGIENIVRIYGPHVVRAIKFIAWSLPVLALAMAFDAEGKTWVPNKTWQTIHGKTRVGDRYLVTVSSDAYNLNQLLNQNRCNEYYRSVAAPDGTVNVWYEACDSNLIINHINPVTVMHRDAEPDEILVFINPGLKKSAETWASKLQFVLRGDGEKIVMRSTRDHTLLYGKIPEARVTVTNLTNAEHKQREIEKQQAIETERIARAEAEGQEQQRIAEAREAERIRAARERFDTRMRELITTVISSDTDALQGQISHLATRFDALAFLVKQFDEERRAAPPSKRSGFWGKAFVFLLLMTGLAVLVNWLVNERHKRQLLTDASTRQTFQDYDKNFNP